MLHTCILLNDSFRIIKIIAWGKEVEYVGWQPGMKFEYTDLNGIVEENGNKYWVVDGMNAYGGLMLIEGAYYYARTYGQLVQNTTYWITKTNNLLPEAYYEFGADGKMLNAPVVEPEQPPVTPDPEPEAKSGIVEEGGKLWWYVDDVKTYGGLMLIDGGS
jgi:hypothetical protein